MHGVSVEKQGRFGNSPTCGFNRLLWSVSEVVKNTFIGAGGRGFDF